MRRRCVHSGRGVFPSESSLPLQSALSAGEIQLRRLERHLRTACRNRPRQFVSGINADSFVKTKTWRSMCCREPASGHPALSDRRADHSAQGGFPMFVRIALCLTLMALTSVASAQKPWVRKGLPVSHNLPPAVMLAEPGPGVGGPGPGVLSASSSLGGTPFGGGMGAGF